MTPVGHMEGRKQRQGQQWMLIRRTTPETGQARLLRAVGVQEGREAWLAHALFGVPSFKFIRHSRIL